MFRSVLLGSFKNYHYISQTVIHLDRLGKIEDK